MTDKERIVELEADNAALHQRISELETLVQELMRQVQQSSQNSHKPPSSDGFKRRTTGRPPSERKPGGQPGHAGQTLERRTTTLPTMVHRPIVCGQCAQSLQGLVGMVVETRQVQDLPVVVLDVVDHRVEAIDCPACGTRTRGTFPASVGAPVQYGPRVRAAAVYLNEGHLVPDDRTVQMLTDLFGLSVSVGSLEAWVQQASQQLAAVDAHLQVAARQASVLHVDETGIRIGGKLHWLHTTATTRHTRLCWSAHRGHQATEAHGVLPQFHGVVVHDRWATYWRYPCQHALCHAHLHRELTAAQEAGDGWAERMQSVLHEVARVVRTAHEHDEPVELLDRQRLWQWYLGVLNLGFAAHPLATAPPAPRRGRPKRTRAENLLWALATHADAVLLMLDRPDVPLTNNCAEQAVRMAKVQQKISGSFRSEAGATAFCRIHSYLATLRKQGMDIWNGVTSLFAGPAFLPTCS